MIGLAIQYNNSLLTLQKEKKLVKYNYKRKAQKAFLLLRAYRYSLKQGGFYKSAKYLFDKL